MGAKLGPLEPHAYRVGKYRVGKPKAITATARKLAIVVYPTLKGNIDYALHRSNS